MKILFITAEGFDTPNANNQLAEVMIRDFLKNGHSVHLIQSHKKGVNPDIPKSLQGAENFTVDTIVRKVVDKTKFIRRYFNEMHYVFLAMKYWKKVKDADVIYLQSNPTIVFTILLLKMFKRKVPIVYSIYDLFPGAAYDIGVVKSKFLYNVMQIVQKPCYKKVQAIAVLSEDMKDKVVKQGAKPEIVHVVPTWFDGSTVKEVPVSENRFLKKYDIKKDKFIVQFAGTIGYTFNYEAVIELAKRLVDDKNIEIQIIGEGNVKQDFINKANELKLDNITFYPLQPVDLIPDVYSACDICIIPLKKGVIGNGVPSKAPILMACKRVIVNSVEINSNYAQAFIDNDMGVAVDVEDYDGLANAVKMLSSSPEKLKIMAENAYRYGKDNHSSDINTKKLMDIFEVVRRK